MQDLELIKELGINLFMALTAITMAVWSIKKLITTFEKNIAERASELVQIMKLHQEAVNEINKRLDILINKN